jgi:glucose/arabinose dehydrogenase
MSTAQNLDNLLGKFLRIDVNTPTGHGSPMDNPYALGGGAPEVYMYGLRNPWRWSFDRATGDIYIGDVGQSSAEEIDVVAAAKAPGSDFGWSDCEGLLDYKGTGCAAPTQPNRIAPVYQQVRPTGGGTSNWTSVIGGQVYRGACYPDLVGRYFFSDNNASGLYSFVWSNGVATDVIQHTGDFPAGPTSIHADSRGELYITYADRRVMHIEAR